MRRALAATTLAAGLVLGGAGASSTAWAAAPAARYVTADRAAALPVTQTPAPATTNKNNDSHPGRWGFAGLTGLLGLFGYRKYKDLRAARSTPTGGVDTDGSGSSRS